MMCLHCGDCCKQFSPLGNPCPHIVQIGTFVLCGIYEGRPSVCRNHEFASSKCPIGLSVLGIADSESYRVRVDEGWALSKTMEDIGIAVECTACHFRKKPRGRSAGLEMANSLCDDDCPGYNQSPEPGSLWPGESRKDFGY